MPATLFAFICIFQVELSNKKDELKGRDSRESSPMKRTRKRGLFTSESCNSLDSEGAMADSKKGLYNEDDSEDEDQCDDGMAFRAMFQLVLSSQ